MWLPLVNPIGFRGTHSISQNIGLATPRTPLVFVFWVPRTTLWLLTPAGSKIWLCTSLFMLRVICALSIEVFLCWCKSDFLLFSMQVSFSLRLLSEGMKRTAMRLFMCKGQCELNLSQLEEAAKQGHSSLWGSWSKYQEIFYCLNVPCSFYQKDNTHSQVFGLLFKLLVGA